jgi:hypothetical protein
MAMTPTTPSGMTWVINPGGTGGWWSSRVLTITETKKAGLLFSKFKRQFPFYQKNFNTFKN